MRDKEELWGKNPNCFESSVELHTRTHRHTDTHTHTHTHTLYHYNLGALGDCNIDGENTSFQEVRCPLTKATSLAFSRNPPHGP